MQLSNFKIKETISEPFSTKQKKSLLDASKDFKFIYKIDAV